MKAVAAVDIIEDLVMAHPMVGHRQRLRSRFLSREKSALTDEGLLELLLTFAIPQKDVRPLAGTLLERFGSLQAVLNADPDLLRQVTGIGDSALVLLKLVGHLAGKNRLPSKAPKILESHTLQQTLFSSDSSEPQVHKPAPLPSQSPRTNRRAPRPRTGLFGKGLMKEIVKFLPQLPDVKSVEEVRTFLRGALHFNSAHTRQRYASYITARLFPTGSIDKALCLFAKQYSGTQALRDVCLYRFMQAEPVVAQFLQDGLFPALGRGFVARVAVRQFLEERFPDAKRQTVQSTASSIIEVLTTAGLARLEKAKLAFQLREVCIESFAFILHSEFPEPGMYDLTKIETHPVLQTLLWRPDKILPALYELRNRGLIAKISEIDSVRQFTTRYHLHDLVQHLREPQGVAW